MYFRPAITNAGLSAEYAKIKYAGQECAKEINHV